MLISRTPLRVSLFGGGTDYPDWFQARRGAVLGLAIDKYIYLCMLPMSGIQSYRYRVAYSQVELVEDLQAIRHRAVRAAFDHYGVKDAMDLSVMADMPASSGLGSSSSFSVGLIHLLTHLRGEKPTKLDLALQAVRLERELLGDNVGVQDQLHASFGGLNRFDFDAQAYRITPAMMRGECLEALLQSMLLVYTGVTRHASAVVTDQLARTQAGQVTHELERMLELVDEAGEVLRCRSPGPMLERLGALLDESWHLKRSLSAGISSADIDELYARAMRHGALGGKLCGAGGGGFLLALVPPGRRDGFTAAMAPARVLNVGLDSHGTSIIHSS